MDAFDVLGLAPSFSLSSSELEQRYRELQRQLHPDKFVHSSSSERRDSLSRAVSVNEAYRLLKDPLKRAELVLTRVAGPSGKVESTADPSLLMEMMELREELAVARKKRDLGEAHRLAESVAAHERSEVEALAQALSRLQGQTSDAAALERAKRALVKLRYYRRFHEEVASLEDDLSD